MDRLEEYNRENEDRGDDFLLVEEALYYAVPSGRQKEEETNWDPTNREIKAVVGEAISEVPGVLALKGRIIDIFKDDDDLTRGISVYETGIGRVEVNARVIADKSCDDGGLIRKMTDAVAEGLRARLGLEVSEVNIEIAEAMSPDDFLERYGAGRSLH